MSLGVSRFMVFFQPVNKLHHSNKGRRKLLNDSKSARNGKSKLSEDLCQYLSKEFDRRHKIKK